MLTSARLTSWGLLTRGVCLFRSVLCISQTAARGGIAGYTSGEICRLFAESRPGRQSDVRRRLNTVSFEALKLAAGLVLLRQTYRCSSWERNTARRRPFLYFVDHADQGLIEAVREGRKREFSSFTWKGAPPDPASSETYLRSKLKWERRIEGDHARLLAYYRAMTGLRRSLSRFRLMRTGRSLAVSVVWRGDRSVNR